MQQEFQFPKGRGGRRERAGRRRGTRVSHHARPQFEKATPVHVTVRVRRHVWNLRSRRCYRRVGECLEEAVCRFGLRVIEYSVMGNHIHLIVEADDATALTRGMQGLSIRIAKSLNALMGRSGRIFDDHYDGRLLKTPTELEGTRFEDFDAVMSANVTDFSASALGQPERCRALLERTLAVRLAGVDYLTVTGLNNLFSRLWKASACLAEGEPLRAELRERVLQAGLAPDELFEEDRQRGAEVRGINYYRIEPGPRLMGQWATLHGNGTINTETLTLLKRLGEDD